MKKFIVTAAVAFAFVLSGGAAEAFVYSGGLIKVGSTGSQVYDLQKCLIDLGDNPSGNLDGIFGNITKAAVMSFQSANGVAVDGIIGPITGPIYTAACADDMDGEDEDEDEDEDADESDFDANDGEEADFTDFDVEDADDDSIQEGQEEVDIAEIEFELEEGGAALLERFDIILDYTGGEGADDDDAWDVFDKIYLEVDGDIIAEVDADDDGDYEDRTTDTATGDDNRLRITGINHVFDAEEDHTIVVKADIAGSVDLGADDQAEWTLTVDERALRFVDEADITVYLSEEDTNADETAVFTIEEEGQEDELTVRESDDDPTSTALEVEDDEKSDWYEIFVFEVDVDEDSQDLTFNDILVTVNTGTENVEDVVDDFELRMGGDTYDDWDFVSGAASTTAVITFDVEDDDLIVDTDEEVDISLYAEFKAANGTNYAQGETVDAEVTSANVDAWDVEGGDDLSATQLQGAATGDTHTLLVDGAVVTLESVSEEALDSGNDDANDVFTATFKINVEAFDEPIYVALAAADAIDGDIIDATDNSATTPGVSNTVTVTSGAEEVETTDSVTYYKVSSDEDFTIKFTEDMAIGEYYAELNGLLFTTQDVAAIADAAVVTDTIVLDDDEFRSGNVTILSAV